jgi:membrane-bound ClpP family serine protease
MMLGLFTIFQLFTTLFQVPVERPETKERTNFDTVQGANATVSDYDRMIRFVEDEESIALVLSEISPGRKGQIEFNGWVWTAASMENEVIEKNQFVRVLGRHQLTYIVKQIPRSLLPPHDLN